MRGTRTGEPQAHRLYGQGVKTCGTLPWGEEGNWCSGDRPVRAVC